jgi:uncharacterized membrane protein YfhO
MVDVAHIGNPLVWQLMNVKYILTDKPDSSSMLVPIYQSNEMNVYAFRYGLPHTFFVRRYEVADGINTLNHIAALSFDPRDIAYVPEQIQTTIDPPREGARVSITRYGTQELEIRATATGNNLLFLSEVYYPKGWKAYIDGKETEILRLDYLFRGVIIPEGIHTLTMKFEPATFALGRIISLSSNLIIFGGLISLLIWMLLHRKKEKGLIQESHNPAQTP